MNVLVQLNQFEKFTYNERMLVEMILSNPTEIVKLKPKEIADRAFVSTSTLYRLVDKLGFNGIFEFKSAIAQALISIQKDQEIEDYDFPILEGDSSLEMTKNLRGIYDRTLQETSFLINHDHLKDMTKALLGAKKIDVYAASANIFFAKNFKFQMQEIGVDVDVPSEDYMQRLTAANSDDSHVAIVVSYGGRGSTTRAVTKILKENKTPVLLITSTQNNHLVAQSDYQIYISSFEHHYNKVSSFSTRMSMLYVFDIIYSMYFKENYKCNVAYKQEHYKRMKIELK